MVKSPASGLLKLVKARFGWIRLDQDCSKASSLRPGLHTLRMPRQYSCQAGVSGLRAPEYSGQVSGSGMPGRRGL